MPILSLRADHGLWQYLRPMARNLPTLRILCGECTAHQYIVCVHQRPDLLVSYPLGRRPSNYVCHGSSRHGGQCLRRNKYSIIMDTRCFTLVALPLYINYCMTAIPKCHNFDDNMKPFFKIINTPSSCNWRSRDEPGSIWKLAIAMKSRKIRTSSAPAPPSTLLPCFS